MNRYTKIKYNCRQATYLIEKKQYGYLSVREIIELYIHLITCPFCRLYKRQTRVIARFLRRLFNRKKSDVMDTGFKERLQKLIEERMNRK